MPPKATSFWVQKIVSLSVHTNTENVRNFILTSQKCAAAWDRGSEDGYRWLGQGWRWNCVLVRLFQAPASNLD